MSTETTDHTEDLATKASETDAVSKTADQTESDTHDERTVNKSESFPPEVVARLRKESATYRSKANELQKKAEEAEKKASELNNTLKASQEEAQKALIESKRLNSAFEQRVINAELREAARESGLVDMDAFKMADVSKIKINNKGDVEGIKELINDLKKDKPYLFKDITTSKETSGAPAQDAEANEKPTYSNSKEFADAKRNFLASLR